MNRLSTRLASTEVKIRGTLVRSSRPDMPTILAFPDLLERPESLRPLFNSKLYEFRNVWFLSYRNSWLSDRHSSMRAEDLADDVIRFMDTNKITTASVVGHGFGAKIASITGILKYHRITSVVGLDYSPMDYTRHEAWHTLKAAVEAAAGIELRGKTAHEVEHILRGKIRDPRLFYSVKTNLDSTDKGDLVWKSGMSEIAHNMNLKDERDNLGKFPLIGLFPGRALFLYSERSNWVHQSSNTIPIYNIFPLLRGTYGQFIDHVDTDSHWLHETDHVRSIARRLAEFYRWYDGVHPLLKDRSEIGTVSLPIRSRDYARPEDIDEVGDPSIPKAIPEHRHHNWGYSERAKDIHFP